MKKFRIQIMYSNKTVWNEYFESHDTRESALEGLDRAIKRFPNQRFRIKEFATTRDN